MAACLLALPSAGLRASTVGRTNPNTGLFADSTMVDLRFLLDAPAGKRGFLRTTPDGHFAWPDGTRARFWGVNLSNKSVFIAKPDIDRVADTLARSGVNMVRLEAIDSAGGLLDVPGKETSRELNPERLDAIDYWVAKLRERGIYVYIDLLDFRQFKAGDEVPAFDKLGRAARPYAFLDRRLIDLQKEYASKLLLHKNPYTGQTLAEDPAVALVELCNEHGLFAKAEMLDDLAEPYGTGFRQAWNRWLQRKYTSRDGLKAAWGVQGGADVLMSFEDPGAGNVQLPLFARSAVCVDPSLVPARRAASRLSDGTRFLYDLQRDYFREMREHLRGIGVRVPITAVVTMDCAPDLASVAAELDFVAGNQYADHPAFAGQDWSGDFHLTNQNYLRQHSPWQIAPTIAAMRWAGKPLVIREWATVWPNSYRAVAVPEMAAYAGLQDVDGALLFGYRTAPKPDTLSDFDHQADPPVWGLFGFGAVLFLRGDVPPAPRTVSLQYAPEDLFAWPNGISSLHRLAWLMRFESREGASTAAVTSRTMLQQAAAARPRRGAASPKPPVPPNPLPIFRADTVSRILGLYSRAGTGMPGDIPAAGGLSGGWGQVIRDTARGRLTINTSRAVAVCGEFGPAGKVTVGGWTFETSTPVGAIMVVSLDGKPLDKSGWFVVKMVSRAENTEQAIAAAQPGMPGPYVISKWGRAPVVTFGRPDRRGTRVAHGGREIAWVGMADGCWEVEVRDSQATLLCDTADIAVRVLGQAQVAMADVPVVVQARAAPKR